MLMGLRVTSIGGRSVPGSGACVYRISIGLACSQTCFPPGQINILEIVNAVDPICRITTCPLDLHGENLCPLHRKMDDALAATESAFRSTHLAELLTGPVKGRPLCLEGEVCHA